MGKGGRNEMIAFGKLSFSTANGNWIHCETESINKNIAKDHRNNK